MKERFTLQHTVLYAKGWYARGDFWADIKKCLQADDYSAEYFRPVDCTRVILGQFERLPFKEHSHAFESILFGIQPDSSWKFGYETKQRFSKPNDSDLPDWELNEAVVRYCLSHFYSLKHEDWDVCEPDFERVLSMHSNVEAEAIERIKSRIKSKP